MACVVLGSFAGSFSSSLVVYRLDIQNTSLFICNCVVFCYVICLEAYYRVAVVLSYCCTHSESSVPSLFRKYHCVFLNVVIF